MKTISLPVAELKSALAGLGKVIPKRSTLTLFNFIRVRQSATGQVDLTTTDLDHTAIYSMKHRGSTEPTLLLVPIEDLNNIVKSCSAADTLTLEQSSDDAIAIRFPVGGQSAEHHCVSAPAEKFTQEVEIKGDAVRVDSALRDSILEALECASVDPTRVILNGAFIDVRNADAHYVVGTDGHHLFSSNSFTIPLKDSVLIPEHKFLGWKGFQQDGDWRLKVQPEQKDQPPRFELASDHWRFLSRSTEGNFPNWKAVVPALPSFQTSISINPEALDEVMQAVQRLPVPEDKHHTLGIQVENSRLIFLGKSKPDMPWTKIPIAEAGTTGPEVTIFCNKRLLLKALRFGLTRIEIIDPISPLRFSRAGRQMILMPLRMEVDNVPAIAPVNTPPPPTDQPQPTPPPMQATHGHHPPAGAHGCSTTPTQAAPPKEETKTSLEAALVQIESIKTGFREAINGLTKVGDHIRQAMREQKTSEKEVQNVRQTLRSLQSVRI
jgi:DNA polymerase III sliding clamp (beta) subunit (PCNA family)